MPPKGVGAWAATPLAGCRRPPVTGLAGLSLRPLAAALGTSPRMLLYDFGSKQELERAPFVRLFFEVHADGLVHPETYPDQGEAITDWFDTLGATFRDVCTGPDDTVTPTVVMAVVRGLLFDLTATGDRDRTDRALERFAELLDR
ncbi:hypothetical protein [Kitasatospora sp. NPDC087314]|uniref:hypothetical protein n=1 Tax=Kitasatospora sp. NPDC087314 TaxID=3364068 RepID=UPI00380D2C70